MACLGHASPQAAMVYQHASLARDVVIAERLAQMAERAGLAPAPAARPRPAPTAMDSDHGRAMVSAGHPWSATAVSGRVWHDRLPAAPRASPRKEKNRP